MKRFTAAAMILTVGLALSACRGLPDSSAVSVGKSVGAADESEPLTVKPDGPLRTDDQRQIAAGFLRAHMDSQGNYAVARSFLTGGAKTQWNPNTSVRIYDASRDIRATASGAKNVRVTLHQVGTLSADGHLTRENKPRSTDVTMELASTPSGWRISHVPEDLGVWISEDDLSRLYSHVNIYYVPRGASHLIPDVRWLPRKGLPTALARAAMQAPPKSIAHAIHTPYPSNTRLDVDAVPVDSDGVAQIDLSAQASAASTQDRKRMWAALTATLMQAPLVTGVNITVNGGSLDAPGVRSPLSDVASIGYEADDSPKDSVISRSGAYLAWSRAAASDAVSGTDKLAAENRPSLPPISAKWSKLAGGRSGAVIAGVSKDGKELAIFADGTHTVPKLDGKNLLRPVVDPQGWVLAAGQEDGANDQKKRPSSQRSATDSADAATTVWLANAGTKDASKMDVEALGGSDIEAWTMSEDGTRLALLVRERTESAGGAKKSGASRSPAETKNDEPALKIQVVTLERAADGKPVKVGVPQNLDVPVTDLQDIAWADATTLAVLGTYDDDRQAVLVPLDGGVTPLGPVPNAVGIASVNDGASGLFLRMRNGSVMTRAGSTWQSFLSGGDVIVPLG